MNAEKQIIMVVEDDPVSRGLLSAFLRKNQYEIVECRDGQEALDIIFPEGEENAPPGPPRCHGVLLDIEMPTMDGNEVLKILRKHYSPVLLPVLMITSRSETADILEAFREGANDFVTKPADLPVLLARIKTHLQLQSAHGALLYAHETLLHDARVESISQLARGLAHELRNPLLQIQMAADGLGNLHTDDKKQQYFLSFINSNIQRADEIVEKIMQDSEALRAKLESGSLNALLEKVLITAAPEADLCGVEVRAKLAPDLPDCLFAEAEMGQALRNLLSNAIQAAAEGGRLVEVVSSLQIMDDPGHSTFIKAGHRFRQGDEVVEVKITDNGPGISDNILSKIFDPFFTTRHVGRGIGMGLTVAQRIIEFHGGHLNVVNRQFQSGVEATVILGSEKQFRAGIS